jgi:hypothetical protein
VAIALNRSTLAVNRLNEKPKTEFLTLEKPPEELRESQEQIVEIEERFKRHRITLTEKQRKELEYQLYYQLTDWKDSRSPLRTKLRAQNDLYEGVVKVTDFPWPGSSQLHVPIPKIKAREIKSTINRNTMRPTPFLMVKYAGPDSLYKESKDFVNDLEDFVEDKMKNSTNVHQALKDAIIPTIRDGTCPVQIIWETEWERVIDYKMYLQVSDFIADYPSAETAGISEEKYSRILAHLRLGNRYEVQYEYDVATYDGPKGYIVPLIDFVHWPVFETDIQSMPLHGKRIWYKDYDLEKFIGMGKFDKAATELVLKSQGDIRDDDTVTIARDSIEGITRNQNQHPSAKEYECYELVCKWDLDQDGTREKYLVYFHWKSRTILRVEKYPIRKGAITYFPLRLIRRDNRFLGMSLIEDIADLSMEIDIVHRMRINSRTITHVPIFKAKETAKQMFDPSRPELRIKPGTVVWLQSVDDVEQFDINPTDLSGSIEEENFLMQLVNLVTGADSGLSGAANPIDPRAPARKQQELLRQSSNRIDDYVESLIVDFSRIGQFIVDLYYQYGEDRIKYYAESKDGSLIQREMDRSKLYNPNVTFQVNGTSVFMNPELEFDRIKEVYGILGTNPITAGDPNIQREILGRVLDASRVKDNKNLLPAEVSAAVAPNGVIPSVEDKEQEAKMAIQKQRLAARLAEGELSRAHELEMAAVENIFSPLPVEEESVAA